MKHRLYLVVNNVRSAGNVGALFRTCDGLGVSELLLCGYTPYPKLNNDPRPPYLADKINQRISKTALGAEVSQAWKRFEDISLALAYLKAIDAELVALEQSSQAINLVEFKPTGSVAVVVGNEVEGLSKEVIKACSKTVVIKMLGQKESFNVASAAAMALFYLRHVV